MVLRFFLFAGAFLFLSCNTAERNNPDDPESSNYVGNRLSSSSPVKHSSSSTVVSSSSVAVTSSSSSSVFKSSSSAAKSSSSAKVSSSSSKPSSSSSVPPSSSSVAQSSSSAAVSSSSSKPSSSSSVPPSSSSVAKSSSSAVVSSSSSFSNPCAGFVNGTKREHYGKQKEQFCDPRDGKKYVYVEIGDQTWMAENLNYDVSGSECYNNDESNCAIYGRLYNWTTAMNLPSSCNSSTCASQVGTKHRGICPNGWHIPSDAEWTTLTNFVGGASTAGKYLKATNGWDYNSNGEDKYGFSALPGGFGYSFGSFKGVGDGGIWWCASEGTSDYACTRDMRYTDERVRYFNDVKANLSSVRCVKD